MAGGKEKISSGEKRCSRLVIRLTDHLANFRGDSYSQLGRLLGFFLPPPPSYPAETIKQKLYELLRHSKGGYQNQLEVAGELKENEHDGR